MSKVVVVVSSLFVFLCTESMRVFDHTSSFNQAMMQEYRRLKKLSDTEIVGDFLCCCKQASSIDAGIKNELDNIVRNRPLAKVRNQDRRCSDLHKGRRLSEPQIIDTGDDIESEVELFSEISVR